MSGSEPSIPKLFVDRMQREGRIDVWRETLATVQAETGLKYGQAKWIAMKRMGYEGPKQERALHAAWLAKNYPESSADLIEQQVEHTDRVYQSEEDDDLSQGRFQEFCNKLPTYASPAIELDWLLHHNILWRGINQEERQPVEIYESDILKPRHGPAPSLFAFIALEYLVSAINGEASRDDAINIYAIASMRNP
jgi:hypothetical protein